MGVPKGTDNFKAHRSSKQRAVLELLRSELEKARRRKMPYPDKATLVADMSERTGVHRTTLTRNPLYHRLLLEHLGSQAGGPSLVADKDAPPELLRAKLIDAQMDLGRLHRELAKARQSSAEAAGQPLALANSAAHTAFSDTVWLLREVLERVNADGETFQVDFATGELRDLSAPLGRQVVASGPRARPFIEAYRRLLQQEGRA